MDAVWPASVSGPITDQYVLQGTHLSLTGWDLFAASDCEMKAAITKKAASTFNAAAADFGNVAQYVYTHATLLILTEIKAQNVAQIHDSFLNQFMVRKRI